MQDVTNPLNVLATPGPEFYEGDLAADAADTYDYGDRAIVAVFPDRSTAKHAIDALHKLGFHQTWLGVTHTEESGFISEPSQNTIDAVDENPFAAIGRFFTHENRRSLQETLQSHGVSADTAAELDRTLPSNSCLLTVDSNEDSVGAVRVIEELGGQIVPAEANAGRARMDVGSARKPEVPVIREELYIERRPMTRESTTSSPSI